MMSSAKDIDIQPRGDIIIINSQYVYTGRLCLQKEIRLL